VYLDGIVLKRTWAEVVRNVSILIAFGVNVQGFREILGAAEGTKPKMNLSNCYKSSPALYARGCIQHDRES